MKPKKSADLTDDSKRIMTELRRETRDYHAKLESLPYFKSLIDHQLPLQCYVNQLRALSIIHAVLENELSASPDILVSLVWQNELRKLPLLEKDLVFFEPRIVPDATASVEAALALTDKIRLRSAEKPYSLLGHLYVFEGSTLGNSMHQPDISSTFRLEKIDGCRYYASYREKVQHSWKHFSELMNKALDDTELHDSIIEAAHEAFSGLELLYEALYPLEESGKIFHVSRINPEAGNHPIPGDEREIDAALKASDLGWTAFPYYEQRYGLRGKRFADSDTCWLVTLTALKQEIMQKQIDWLCRVLATRGMPTLMMEQTLRLLHEELVAAVPEKKTAYDRLLVSADALAQVRQRSIGNTMLHGLAGEFAREVDADPAGANSNIGELLVAAVADEHNGMKGTVAALSEWLTDEERFSVDWIRAVSRTIEKAENCISEQAGRSPYQQ